MARSRQKDTLLLVNANLLKPVVAPLALDYLSSCLREAGVPTVIADLAWEKHPESALTRILREREYALVGLTVRNTEDCYFKTRQFFLPSARRLVKIVDRESAAPVVVGGVGYSIFPAEALNFLGVDFGICGDGEEALPLLWEALREGDLRRVPGLVYRGPRGVRRNPPARARLDRLPPFGRDGVDNPRYLREGAMVGFETKRGCPMKCVYCADPVSKGRKVRLRPPRAVAGELADLHRRGVDTFHTCDSEFNLPPGHAAEVCREIIRLGLGDRIRWYAYATPSFFSGELAALMRRAGCVGVNFGVDSAHDGQLARLGRVHRRRDIAAAGRACRDAGLVTMFDLLIGGPGETFRTLETTIGAMKVLGPERVGLSVGVRVYPGTPLAGTLESLRDGLTWADGTETLLRPVFFLSPALGEDVEGRILELIGGDERFFTAGLGDDDRDYNYSGHTLLVKAIGQGQRGAFWDILRRLQEGDSD
jgi:hypothetical protein